MLIAGVSSLEPGQVVGTVAIVELVIVGTLAGAAGLRWMQRHERREYPTYSATCDPVAAPYPARQVEPPAPVVRVLPAAPKQIEAPRETQALEVT